MIVGCALLAAPAAFAISPADLAQRIERENDVLLVDVRSASAYAEGHIPGAINIPASLLPHKQLPSSQLVVVYGDGLGLVDDAQALEVAQRKVRTKADVLEGGYAAWLAETRVSTAQPGVSPEKVPGITYEQLLATRKDDLVLVDLRGLGQPAASAQPLAAKRQAGQQTSRTMRAAATSEDAPESDVIGNLGKKLGVPVVAAGKAVVAGVADPGAARRSPTSARPTTERVASTSPEIPAIDLPNDPTKLLVLVAEDDSAANEIARQLRSRGHYRFTLLIGGTESIRHEGRTGSARMDGKTGAITQ